MDNFFPHYPHAKTLDFKGFFKVQKKLSTFFLKLSTKKGRVIHIFFGILCKPKNVDNFVDRWVKFDILGRKLVKKGDKFQDIGVNEQKYNVDKM